MAAFNPKPWFKQPIGSSIKVKSSSKLSPYQEKQIPLALDTSTNINFENISFSYEIFNEVIIWGLVNYQKLTEFFTHKVEIHGTKLSFDKDTFRKLSPKDKIQFKLLKEIKEGDKSYNRLSLSQKYISNLLNNYKKSSQEIKNKYLKICKSKLENEDGTYTYDFKILDYPDYIDSSESKADELLKKEKMPFGSNKGKLIKNLSKDYIQKFTQTKEFKENSKLQELFKKYHDDITQNGGSNKKKKRTKKRRKSQKRKKSQRKRKRTKKKSLKVPAKNCKLYYFTMNGCPYCKEFDNIWEDLIPSIPKLTTEKSEDQQKIEELNINSFPTILLMKKNKPIQFKENRDIPTIHRFLKKNVSNMV